MRARSSRGEASTSTETATTAKRHDRACVDDVACVGPLGGCVSPRLRLGEKCGSERGDVRAIPVCAITNRLFHGWFSSAFEWHARVTITKFGSRTNAKLRQLPVARYGATQTRRTAHTRVCRVPLGVYVRCLDDRGYIPLEGQPDTEETPEGRKRRVAG